MSNLREFTWSARVIQFLPLAGALAVARRSVPVAGLLLTWLLGYVVVKGSASVATDRVGKLLAPRDARPSGVRAAVGGRAAPRPDIPQPDGGPAGAGSGPSAWVPWDRRNGAPVQRRPDRRAARIVTAARGDERVPGRPIEGDHPGQHRRSVGLECRRPRRPPNGKRERAHLDRLDDAREDVLPRLPCVGVPRFPDMVCELRGVDRCELRSETLVTTRDQRFVDPDPPPDAVYRIGVAANWLDETDRGDVFVLSPPVVPS